MLEERIKASAEYKELIQSIRSGGLSHAYLLLGGDTAVRTVYIKMLASAILCRDGGCGECPTCEKIATESHIDVKYYNKDGKMRVADAIALIDDSYIKGWESATKLYFVLSAETLLPPVQNKLLKLYEEPPAGAAIFLQAGSEGGLLQTIVSRAKKIYLPSFSSKDIYEELLEEGYDAGQAETASALSGGRFDKAYLFAAGDSYPKLYDDCFRTLIGCKSSRDVPSYSGGDLFSKENLSATIEIMEVILSDVLALVSGSGVPPASHNREYDLGEIGKGFSPGGVAMAILVLSKARKMLNSYVSAAAIADTILLEILEAKYKWR